MAPLQALARNVRWNHCLSNRPCVLRCGPVAARAGRWRNHHKNTIICYLQASFRGIANFTLTNRLCGNRTHNIHCHQASRTSAYLIAASGIPPFSSHIHPHSNKNINQHWPSWELNPPSCYATRQGLIHTISLLHTTPQHAHPSHLHSSDTN